MKHVSRWVIGYEGIYRVSNYGTVWNVNYRGTGKRRKLVGRVTQYGYHTVKLRQGFTTWNNKFVHRLVLEAFVGPCPKGMEACHNDGCKTNNRLDNLRWDTRSNNQKDIKKHDSDWRTGGRNGRVRLSKKLCTKMRKMYAAKTHTQAQLAKRFRLSATTVFRAIHKKTWLD